MKIKNISKLMCVCVFSQYVEVRGQLEKAQLVVAERGEQLSVISDTLEAVQSGGEAADQHLVTVFECVCGGGFVCTIQN